MGFFPKVKTRWGIAPTTPEVLDARCDDRCPLLPPAMNCGVVLGEFIADKSSNGRPSPPEPAQAYRPRDRAHLGHSRTRQSLIEQKLSTNVRPQDQALKLDRSEPHGIHSPHGTEDYEFVFICGLSFVRSLGRHYLQTRKPAYTHSPFLPPLARPDRPRIDVIRNSRLSSGNRR